MAQVRVVAKKPGGCCVGGAMVGASWALGGAVEIELEDNGGDKKGGPVARRSG